MSGGKNRSVHMNGIATAYVAKQSSSADLHRKARLAASATKTPAWKNRTLSAHAHKGSGRHS
jgi:hypothetical protein